METSRILAGVVPPRRRRLAVGAALLTTVVAATISPGAAARTTFPSPCGRNSHDQEATLTFRIKLVARKTTHRSYAYFYEISARRAFRANVADTMGFVRYRSPGARSARTHPVDAVVRDRTRARKQPWYYHGTVRVARGSKISYFFRQPYRKPIPIPGGRIVAYRYFGSCRASVG